MLTQATLKEHLHYDPITGIFTRLKSRTRKELIGLPTGAIDRLGYVIITIQSKVYKAHRLAWLYITGAWPDDEVDHANTVRSDNAFTNLRSATTQENSLNRSLYKNNKSGIKGVCWMARNRKWAAYIHSGTDRHYLGLHSSKEEAGAAVKAKRAQLHGEFCNHG